MGGVVGNRRPGSYTDSAFKPHITPVFARDDFALFFQHLYDLVHPIIRPSGQCAVSQTLVTTCGL